MPDVANVDFFATTLAEVPRSQTQSSLAVNFVASAVFSIPREQTQRDISHLDIIGGGISIGGRISKFNQGLH